MPNGQLCQIVPAMSQFHLVNMSRHVMSNCIVSVCCSISHFQQRTARPQRARSFLYWLLQMVSCQLSSGYEGVVRLFTILLSRPPNFSYGVCFMVCYVFTCKDCSPTKTESWIPKQASEFLRSLSLSIFLSLTLPPSGFSHMAITVLANLTAETLKAEGRLNVNSGEGDPVYFGLYEKILPYFDNNWENLTSMPRRAKNTWHQTLQKALAKETGLFRVG